MKTNYKTKESEGELYKTEVSAGGDETTSADTKTTVDSYQKKCWTTTRSTTRILVGSKVISHTFYILHKTET